MCVDDDERRRWLYGDGDLICPPRVRGRVSRHQLKLRAEPRSHGWVWLVGACMHAAPRYYYTTVATSSCMDGELIVGRFMIVETWEVSDEFNGCGKLPSAISCCSTV